MATTNAANVFKVSTWKVMDIAMKLYLTAMFTWEIIASTVKTHTKTTITIVVEHLE